MAENREEVLSQLYALRAGMSYISAEVVPLEEREKANTIKINDQLQCIRDRARDAGVYETSKDGTAEECMRKVKERLSFAEKNVEKANNEYQKERSDWQKGLKRNRTILILLCCVTLVAIILAVVGRLVDLESLMYLGIAASVFCGIGTIVFWFFAISLVKDVKPTESKVTVAEIDMERLKKAEKDILPMIDTLSSLQEDEEGKALQAEVYEAVEPVRSALVQTYSGIIDERDWQYLDLVIFYYETRRADSIKEALQLVDRQKQTEMIVSAVQEAGREICSAIYNAAQMLASTIVKCCNIICKNMNANAAAVVDALTLQNSLLEEASRTSAQMAEDIKFIKSKMPKRRIASSKSAD